MIYYGIRIIINDSCYYASNINVLPIINQTYCDMTSYAWAARIWITEDDANEDMKLLTEWLLGIKGLRKVEIVNLDEIGKYDLGLTRLKNIIRI